MKAQNIFLDENTGGKGRYFKSRFLQPGLVKYSFGVCVLDKATIDKFIQGFVGCPVIIGHKDVTNASAKDDRVGVISRIWYDNADGWFWGEGIIFDEKAISLVESGYNVSCQYDITEYSNNTTKALHNGNPYDKVILNGKPEHLAIVENPRYENAMIAVNALDLTAENEDKWITIKPNGEDGKGRHLLLKDGESPKEAIERTYGKGEKSDTKGEKKRGDLGEDSPRHIYGKKTKDSIAVALKTTYYPNWNKEEIVKVFDNEEDALDYAEERGKAVKSDYQNKTKTAEKYGLATWVTPKQLEHIKKHGYFPEEEPESSDKSDSKEDIYNNLLKDSALVKHLQESVKARKAEDPNAKVGDTIIDSDSFISNYVDKLTSEQYKKFNWDKAEDFVFDKLKEFERDAGFKEQDTAKNTIIQAINEIKENSMFKKLFNKKEKFTMEKDEMKALFIDCIQDVLKAQNEEDIEDVEFEEDEEKAENKKCKNKKCKNEDVDKRKLIDEVAGIMKSAGCDDEDIRTAIAKMEKIGYDKSEADKADNSKKAKCEDEEDLEEAKNKAKNSIDELKGFLSSAGIKKSASKYMTKAQAIELGNKLF